MRVTRERAGDPAAIDELCEEADAWEVATYVTLPAGIALLVAGTVLTLSSDTVRSSKTALRLIPHVGHDNGGASLVYSF